MLTLVVLYASWCPKCHMMLPIVDELELELEEKLRVVRVDIEKEPDKMIPYEVEIVPTFVLLKGSREVGKMAGMIGEETLRKRIEEQMEKEE